MCAGTPESPEEMAGRQVVKAMMGEVPPQQSSTEQDEPTRGVAQPLLKEENCMGWGHKPYEILPYLALTFTSLYIVSMVYPVCCVLFPFCRFKSCTEQLEEQTKQDRVWITSS